MNPNIVRKRTLHSVISLRELTPSTFVLRFTRNGLEFQPGQHLYVGLSEDMHMREYSIYSGVQEEFLEILVKEIPEGLLSPRLRRLQPGDHLYIAGPFGTFRILDELKGRPHTFISTGTGIAPFHCFAGSYPGLSYTLLHGTRYNHEAYELQTYNQDNLIRCISGEDSPYFPGRVTHYLREHPVSPGGVVYLCGNSDMIYETYDLLQDQGIERKNIFAEVYF